MNEYLTKKRSSGDYGKQETLPPSLQTKMNQSFGMDFSSVKVYRNDEMAGTGMKGLASGNRVILSKEINLNTLDGQAVLGHELSHIHAQSQGIGSGHSGLYDNAALEHQADTEGRMAAMGQSVYGAPGGMPIFAGMQNMGGLQPLSGGLSASAGAPMQADKPRKRSNAVYEKNPHQDDDYYKSVRQRYAEGDLNVEAAGYKQRMLHPKRAVDPVADLTHSWRKGVDPTYEEIVKHNPNYTAAEFVNPFSLSSQGKKILSAFSEKNGVQNSMVSWSNGRFVSGLNMHRMVGSRWASLQEELPEEEFEKIYKGLNSKNDDDISKGLLAYKKACYQKLQKMQAKYGKLLSQMDPQDAMRRLGQNGGGRDFAFIQDALQLHMNIPEEFKSKVSLGENEENFGDLARYYSQVGNAMISKMGESAAQFASDPNDRLAKSSSFKLLADNALQKAKGFEDKIQGPSLDPKRKKQYEQYLRHISKRSKGQ